MIKLLSISHTFEKNEDFKFKQYICLYFSPKSKAHILADWILTCKLQKPIEEISLDDLYQLSPKLVKKQSFKNLISELGNLAEEFIAWKHWQSNENLKNTSKLISLAERNLNNFYLLIQKKLQTKYANQPIDIFSEYYRTITLFYEYNYRISDSKDNYEDLFKNLINSFKTGVAKVAQSLLVEMKNRERLLETENWINEMVFFDLLYENSTDIIHITDQLLLLNNESDMNAYDELIKILKDPESKKLSHFLRYSILIYCSVFLVGVFKTGNHEKVDELLGIYEYGLENKILTPNESIDSRTFLNVISVFSKLSNSEKTMEIINKYSEKVEYADTKIIKQLAVSTLDFNNGRFEKVIKELRTVEPIGFQLKFKTRWLQLKSIIEVQRAYPEAIAIQVSNFKRYINSNKHQINKPTYDGLIVTLNLIIMIVNGEPKLEIKDAIIMSRLIFEKRWVIDFLARTEL